MGMFVELAVSVVASLRLIDDHGCVARSVWLSHANSASREEAERLTTSSHRMDFSFCWRVSRRRVLSILVSAFRFGMFQFECFADLLLCAWLKLKLRL